VSTRDEDILDFDFFDEEEAPAWEEPAERSGAGPPRGRGPRVRRPRLRGTGNLTPLLRLVGLIALAILVVVLLAVWVEGCVADRQRVRYTDYMAEIGAVGNNSARLGQQLNGLLTTPGLNQEDLDAKLRGFVQTAENQVQRADGIDPPGPLHDAHEGALEALRFRVSGLQGLQTAFRETIAADDAGAAGQALAAQTQRLLASDVLWADSFRVRAEAALEDEEVEGVQPPASRFVTMDDLTAASSLAAIWRRIRGAAEDGTPTGLRGTQIAYVKVLPGGTLLSTTTEATIRVTDALAFEVGVEDSGDHQEVDIDVTLTIPKTPEPIVQTKTIAIIDPGETKSVTFRVGTLVSFGEQVRIRVDVEPVRGETFTANNTAEYPVVFTL
jgi:hypothetical protein